MVVSNVCCRCFTALIKPCALRVCSSSSSVNWRLRRNSGTLRLFKLRVMVSSSYVSTMKSGMICCIFLPIASPSELPGRGFSLVRSLTASLYCSSVIPSFWIILSLFLRVNSSQHLPMMSSSICFNGESAFLCICSRRHSCKLRAPIPAGSKSWIISKILFNSSSVV